MAALSDELTLLYIGYFNRLADPEGAAFWQAVYDSGFPLDAIAEDFSTQAEAIAIYSYFGEPSVGTPAFFLTEVYENLFNRSPDGPGLTFWSSYIEAGGRIGDVILSIIQGASPADRVILDDALEIAEYWYDLADNDPNFVWSSLALEAFRNALDQNRADLTDRAEVLSDIDLFFAGAPSLTLTSVLTSLSEATDTSVRIKVAEIAVFEATDTVSPVTLTGANADLFEIDGMGVYLKAGVVLDYETLPEVSVTVQVDDDQVGQSPDDAVSISLTVLNAFEPEPAENILPTVALINTVMELSESVSTSSRTKVADIRIGDLDNLGRNELSLSGADAELFEIDGLELYLRAGAILDYETNGTLDVTVIVDDVSDLRFPDDTANLSIALSDVNEAPNVALSNIVRSLSEGADVTSRTKVADIVVTDDALGDETLGLTGTDSDLFEIVGTVLYLKTASALDFETNSVLDVTVTVNDASIGTGSDDTAPLQISVMDVNEAPSVALSNTVISLGEDEGKIARVKVADIVVTDDGLGTETLGLTGADADLFEIEWEVLYLKVGAALDFESDAVLDVTLTVDDTSIGADIEDSAQLQISVTDVNEAPSVALLNTVTSLPENQDTTLRIKVADIVVTDDALGDETLGLAGANAGQFEIVGSVLYLSAGAVLDFEANAVLDVMVTVDDASIGAGVENSAPLQIALTDVNEAPSVALSNMVTSLPEDEDTTTRIKVADIVVTDDALGTETLGLTGTEAGLLQIENFVLYLRAGTALDFETNALLDLSVTVDDASIGVGVDDSAPLQINVLDRNEAPELTGTPAVLANGIENTAYLVAVSDLLQGYTDVDGDLLRVANLGVNNGATFADNDDGTFTITPTADFAGAIELNYDVTDGALSVAATANLIFPIIAVDDSFDVETFGTVTGNLAGNDKLLIETATGELVAGTTFELASVSALRPYPWYGTLDLNDDGSFSYTSTGPYRGQDQFAYTVTQPNGLSSTGIVTINLSQDSDPELAGSVDFGGAIVSRFEMIQDATGRPTGAIEIKYDLDIQSIYDAASGDPADIEARLRFFEPSSIGASLGEGSATGPVDLYDSAFSIGSAQQPEGVTAGIKNGQLTASLNASAIESNGSTDWAFRYGYENYTLVNAVVSLDTTFTPIETVTPNYNFATGTFSAPMNILTDLDLHFDRPIYNGLPGTDAVTANNGSDIVFSEDGLDGADGTDPDGFLNRSILGQPGINFLTGADGPAPGVGANGGDGSEGGDGLLKFVSGIIPVPIIENVAGGAGGVGGDGAATTYGIFGSLSDTAIVLGGNGAAGGFGGMGGDGANAGEFDVFDMLFASPGRGGNGGNGGNGGDTGYGIVTGNLADAIYGGDGGHGGQGGDSGAYIGESTTISSVIIGIFTVLGGAPGSGGKGGNTEYTILANGGDDVIVGGKGGDAGDGGKRQFTDTGTLVANGGRGGDTLYKILAGEGDDTVAGGQGGSSGPGGSDTRYEIYGEDGEDVISGGPSGSGGESGIVSYLLDGGNDDDALYGGLLNGNATYTLYGGKGNDLLVYGGKSTSTEAKLYQILGGDDDDTIRFDALLTVDDVANGLNVVGGSGFDIVQISEIRDSFDPFEFVRSRLDGLDEQDAIRASLVTMFADENSISGVELFILGSEDTEGFGNSFLINAITLAAVSGLIVPGAVAPGGTSVPDARHIFVEGVSDARLFLAETDAEWQSAGVQEQGGITYDGWFNDTEDVFLWVHNLWLDFA